MFAFGATDRIEIFGAFGARRIDADLVPVARNGQPQDYLINKGWSTGIGDAWVGAKFNITSQAIVERLRHGAARDGEAARPRAWTTASAPASLISSST